MQYAGNQLDFQERDAITIRQPAYAQLLIDSEDRQAGQPANDFTIYRNQALLYGYFYRLAITQIQFHWDLPTIVTNVNDRFYFSENNSSTNALVIIPQGYYNPTTLAAAIQTAIRAADANWVSYVCVFDDLTNGFVIDTGGGANIRFNFPLYEPVAYDLKNYPVLRNTARSLGITVANTIFSPTQTLAVPQLVYTQFIDIVSRSLTKFQRVKDADTSLVNPKSFIVARLYLCPPNTAVATTATSGIGSNPFFICVDYNTPKMIKYSPDEALSEIDLQVLDEYGDPLYWDPITADWSYEFTLLASES